MGTQWFQYQYATIYLTTECALLSKWVLGKFHVQVTWVNNRHLAMPPFFSLQSVVRGTSTEIPYWWCVTSLIWVALLICPAKSKIYFWTNQKHYSYLGSDPSAVSNFCSHSSNIILQGNQWLGEGGFYSEELNVFKYGIIIIINYE